MRRWILHGQLLQVKCSFRPEFPKNLSLTACMIINKGKGRPTVSSSLPSGQRGFSKVGVPIVATLAAVFRVLILVDW